MRPFKAETPFGEKRTIGHLNNNGVLIMHRYHEDHPEARGQGHFMRKYRGFGLTVMALNQAKDMADEIRIIYHTKKGTAEVYIASPETWEEKGVEAREGGYEKQVFLSVDDFDKVKK